MEQYLKATYYFDYEHDNIQKIVSEIKGNGLDEKEQAVKLYYLIRDRWRYNPNYISFISEESKASYIASKNDGHCIDKAVLYIACLRAINIPSRLRLAKIKNHIGVEKLEKILKTNELTPHGITEVFLDDKWVKATPAFNKELCELCNVEPLNFDGVTDSVFQEYSKSNQKFMEYLEDYGHFADLPSEFIVANMKDNYPHVFESEDFNERKLKF